ncbi:deoxyribodipyrimidine photo-lyase [Episyrphus balteatus]|uniref:deoxyribodipyrimidine photo-lyase n=1 Tax=Episyrphus balteatus TaxID=286459 RepID=UPI002485FB8A|nr:deoxyribodipyrimidine photo-lyase [Episyrphus balteatus]
MSLNTLRLKLINIFNIKTCTKLNLPTIYFTTNCNLNISTFSTMKRTANSQSSSVKKQKVLAGFPDSKKPNNESVAGVTQFLTKIQSNRLEAGDSIIDFQFKKKRVRILSEATDVPENADAILYWMDRDARVQDNWAFLFAQKLALKNEIPLMVCVCPGPKYLSLRLYKYMLSGLEEVEKECRNLNINFHLLLGEAPKEIPKLVKQYNIGAVVCDFSPLRLPVKWVNEVKDSLPAEVPLTQVDAHNVVPAWVASDKQEYAARTIRNKITSKLGMFFTEFPPLIKHPHSYKTKAEETNWKAALDYVVNTLKCDMNVDDVDWATPGYVGGMTQLLDFCTRRLKNYDSKRNDPTLDVISNLSPWYNFGHISVQRSALEISRLKSKYKASVEAYCEESIVRRELADNFCFYNEKYDSLQGIASWSLKTLDDHRKDKREWLYTQEELETSKTHDDLWNSAQIQLVKEGKMHGFLRMYWAKKILEWTKSPEEALNFALLFNDKYSLDGCDPNGFVGCMWSIGGIHDQGWGERPIFGKIRYMNYQGCKRKFDVPAFVARYGGKVYSKKK